MTDPDTLTVMGLKVATLISSAAAAVLSVAVEWRKHDALTAVGSILAGIFVATVATEATIDFLDMADKSGTWSHTIAAVYGITGRNIIIWARNASSDPTSFIRQILGLGKKDGDS